MGVEKAIQFCVSFHLEILVFAVLIVDLVVGGRSLVNRLYLLFLLQMSTRRGSTEVHEFDGMFQGFKAHYRVTSVIGHVFRFSLTYQYYTKSRYMGIGVLASA